MILVAVLLAVPVGAAEKDSKNPLNPTGGGHFEVVDPAEKLAPDKAERIYRRLRPRLRAAYALSADRTAGGYAKWRRFNRAPYESKQHGGRYLSNYGNQAAQAYGRFEKAGKLPPGAIIAKDSSSVGKDGQVLPGPLFIMEKMAPGFDKASGDWRYSQIMPRWFHPRCQQRAGCRERGILWALPRPRGPSRPPLFHPQGLSPRPC
jgi:hypothetical protein